MVTLVQKTLALSLIALGIHMLTSPDGIIALMGAGLALYGVDLFD